MPVTRERTPWRDPNAYLPLAMSAAATALVLVHVARFGTLRQADEGTEAHLYQLLMLLQLPFVGAFAVRWLPRAPGKATRVLLAQAAMGIAALASLYYFESRG